MPTARTHSPEGWQRRQLRGKVCSFPRSSPSPLELIGKRKSQGEGGRVGRAPDGTGTSGPPVSLKRRGPRGRGGNAAGAGAAAELREARLQRGHRAGLRAFSTAPLTSCPAPPPLAAPRPGRRHVLGAGRCPRAVPALAPLSPPPAPRRLSPRDPRRRVRAVEHRRDRGAQLRQRARRRRSRVCFHSNITDTPNIYD